MAFIVGPITQVLVSPTGVSLTSPAATGGTAPYTYQWFRSQDPNFTPGVDTMLPGATALDLVDGPVLPNSIYYYKIVATDNAAATAQASMGVCTPAKGQLLYLNPTFAQFKAFFDRDFPFGTDMNTSVREQDVLRAFSEVNTQINQTLYLSQAAYTYGYMYFSAHTLATNLQNSSQGMNGQYNWIQQSKGVGPISESFAIPEQIQKNPYFAALTKTTYGNKYLMDLLPRMTGAMGSVFGNTKP